MVEINKLLLTNNNCYKTGKKMTPKGVMYHSTGANNPKLSRYVGPDDGVLGSNSYNNHWNQPKPGGRSVCVHAFIGKDKNGKVRIYQTLPWNHVGWHSGYGKQGSANTKGYIGFEICEDALNDKVYFDECVNLANQLTAYLVKTYNIPINNKTIISHSEGSKLGIASNHADIEHWTKRFGMTMNDIRKEVQKLVNGTPSKPVEPSPPKTNDNIYVVKKGDTLWGISNKYKTTVASLKNWNSLKGDLIDIGQRLIVYKTVTPVSKPAPAPVKPSINIKVDGYWGTDTTKALQKYLGTTVDGIISGQYNNTTTRAISSTKRTPTKNGSSVIKALQRKLKVTADGYIGAQTIRALQKYLGTPIDGVVSKPSVMVRELQRRLNNGTF